MSVLKSLLSQHKSVMDLADKLGVSQSYLSSMVSGYRQMSYHVALKIHFLYNIPLWQLKPELFREVEKLKEKQKE